MKKIFVVFSLLAIIIFVACTQKSNPTTTVKEKHKEKETHMAMKTTYMGGVQQLIQAKCSPCHLPSKGGNKASFENYASAAKYGPDMITRIERNPGDKGFMPFKNAKLSEDEIKTFKKWVSDGLMEK